MRYKRLYHFRPITTLHTTLNSVRCDLCALYGKKTERPITGSSVQNDLMKKIKITNLLTKRYFEEIWYLVMYDVLLFNYQVKNTVPSSQTPVFIEKKYQIY